MVHPVGLKVTTRWSASSTNALKCESIRGQLTHTATTSNTVIM